MAGTTLIAAPGTPAPLPYPIDQPLCVDLDGSLLRVDTLQESVILLLKTQPLAIFSCFLWLMRGKAYLKRRIAQIIVPQADLLPYRTPLLAMLRQERELGRKIYLVTGADRAIAEGVAEHLGLFDGIGASDGETNLTSVRKLAWIEREFAGRDPIYIGDSRKDEVIWKKAGHGVLAGNAIARAGRLRSEGVAVTAVPDELPGKLKSVVRMMRPHHWMKNLLVFVPAFLAHRYTELELFVPATISFFAISTLASLLYIVNDLFDVEADRQHARKRTRPLASGALSAVDGVITAVGLLVVHVALASQLPMEAVGLLAIYGVSSFVYSLFLKQMLFIDVIVLAGLFTLRILLGGAATDIEISDWTLEFSMFIFLSLALVKRLNEIRAQAGRDSDQLSNRGYLTQDLVVVSALGAASSYAAVLVFLLYINSDNVRRAYSHPRYLWLVGAIFLYWLSRFWILVNRGYLHDDPLVFAFRDRASICCCIAAAGLVWMAI